VQVKSNEDLQTERDDLVLRIEAITKHMDANNLVLPKELTMVVAVLPKELTLVVAEKKDKPKVSLVDEYKAKLAKMT